MSGAWTWILDFIGVHNGENDFSTHMYNFWSGFGGNVSVLALLGGLVGIYRHHLRHVAIHPLHRRRRTVDRDADGDEIEDEVHDEVR